MSHSAVGVSPHTGAAAATLFQSNSAGVRVFPNRRPAPAGLTDSIAISGSLAAPQNALRHTRSSARGCVLTASWAAGAVFPPRAAFCEDFSSPRALKTRSLPPIASLCGHPQECRTALAPYANSPLRDCRPDPCPGISTGAGRPPLRPVGYNRVHGRQGNSSLPALQTYSQAPRGAI